MERLILSLSAILLLLLVWERIQARRDRRALRHVIHVNGTRGKSTVSRLIDAGLRAGGWRVFCKTTGTDPMTIGVDGAERPIRRIGPSNIKEQLRILHQAVGEGAQVMVVECMALQPQLQHTAQHDMLLADIGVITNVRRDHTDVMGETLPEICAALCNTVPKDGVLFTAEQTLTGQMGDAARKLGSRFVPVTPCGEEPEFEFAENIALALAVCQELGVEREQALAGMTQYRPDPYALTIYRLGQGYFANGMSANDPQSTRMVYDQVLARLPSAPARRVLLINNRADRGARTRDMLTVAEELSPDEVWLMGAGQSYFSRQLGRRRPELPLVRLTGGNDPRLKRLPQGWLIFAAGNIAHDGKILMGWVREEGERLV